VRIENVEEKQDSDLNFSTNLAKAERTGKERCAFMI